jgi:glycerol-3-phosphate dehydrogenase (NAD(P)+)
MIAYSHIAVLGAGAWGTALANIVVRADRRVTLWSRDPALATALAQSRENARLPGIRLLDAVVVTSSVGAAASADALLLAVPAQSVRTAALALAPFLGPGVPVVVCAKGIERGTRQFMTDVISECLPQAVPAVLSGPSFASDVARGLPTAVTLAAGDATIARGLAVALGAATFRLYHSRDVRGVEIGGAAKNVLAIAAGIVRARNLGASAAAALTTRGFAELARFGQAYGAERETLTGLSGLGDLILTCSSGQSRNFSLGVALGTGLTLEEAQRDRSLVEGMLTASVLVEMAAERGIDMPISSSVTAVLEGRLNIDAAIASLLTRPFRAEYDGVERVGGLETIS